MRLPTITQDTSISQWNSLASGDAPPPLTGNIDYIGEEADAKLNEVELEDLFDELDAIREKYNKQYKDGVPKSAGGRIESEMVEPIHQAFLVLATPGQLSNIGFWRWLSNVAYRGKFWDFIDWRFDERQQVNWAITSPRSLKESLFFRCWLRGHKMYNPESPDPYKYARMGTGDFWRSHVLRQDFGKDRTFVEAFLDFNFTSDGTRNISDAQLRKKLIPGVRAWCSMATFSHLSHGEITAILSKIWEQES
jgi:hypothetical protein